MARHKNKGGRKPRSGSKRQLKLHLDGMRKADDARAVIKGAMTHAEFEAIHGKH
jgi:hypothetical protein